MSLTNNVALEENMMDDPEFSPFGLSKEQESKIKEHYNNPKNNKVLENYNARGIGRNPDNWGQVDMYLLVDEKEILRDLGYEYKGCPTISFTASVFTEELKGVKLEDAYNSTQKELEVLNAQDNCDDCIKMILVAFLCAYENYHQRIKGENSEDYSFSLIDTTVPKNPQLTEQSCGI